MRASPSAAAAEARARPGRGGSRAVLALVALASALAGAWTAYLVVTDFEDPAAPVGVLERSFLGFLDAVEALGRRLAEVEPAPLAIALGLVLANLALRSRAWRSILTAAYPSARVHWRTVFGAYVAGVGVNAVLPARAGDPVKLLLVHRRTPGTTYPGLTASLVAETAFDAVVGLGLLTWAISTGALPGLPELPRLPAFDVALVVAHPWITAVVAAAILVAVLIAARRVRAFWSRAAEGLAILRRPRAYLTRVVPYQALGWICRVAGGWLFLEAFNVPGSLEAALAVQVASSLATLLPATPGGLGPKQALLVAMLAGEAARVDVLAFSVGMELATVAFTATLGFACMAVMLRGGGLRRAAAEARAESAQSRSS